MFTIILFVLSSVALSTSQINVGPQTFPEQTSSDKPYVNSQAFKYIISPIQFKNAQNIRPDSKQLDQPHFHKQALLPFIKFSSSEELQNREPLQVPINNQNEKLINKHFKSLTFSNSYEEQKPNQYQLVNIQQVKQLQKEFSPISEYSNKDQIESNLIQQIRQQLSRIADNNQINLRALSIVPEENQYAKAHKSEQLTPPKTNNQEEKQERKTSRKEIEDILRGQVNFESVKQNTDVTEKPNYQKSPYFVHRLVAVTKHHPVNIDQQVEVAVPAPILLPVPEPYEVKVPHPYHVPVEVIRHIPVPGTPY